MILPSRGFQACFIFLVLVGCAGADEHVGSRDVPRETWRLVETARIGSVDGADDALTRVGALLPMPDGGAWLVEPAERRIRAVDPDGTLRALIGGPGQGPGEFTVPGTMGWWNGSPDTVWVSDEFAMRVSLFSLDGEFARSFRMDPIEWEGQWVVAQPTVIGPASVGLGLARYRPGAEVRAHFPLLAFELPSGAPVAQVASVSRTDGVQIRWRGEAVATGVHPMSDAPIVSFSPLGTAISVTERDVVAEPAAPEVHITTLSPSGDTLWRRSIRYEPKRISAEELDAIWVERIEALKRFVTLEGRLTPEEAEEAYVESVRKPTYRPPISAVQMDAAGRLLLTWSAEPGAEAEVWLIDADGGLVASFHVPPGRTVLGFNDDSLWLLEFDDLDVPFIIRARFERT